MSEAEAPGALDNLIKQVDQLIASWNDRSPMLLASVFQESPLGVILDVLTHTEGELPPLYDSLATLLLSRYTHDQGDLDLYRTDLWEILEAEDARQWPLRQLLAKVLTITGQQPRSHPNYEIYHALGLLSEEVLQELETRVSPYPRRRKRRYAVSIARTAELPELSALTFEPVDSKVQAPRRKTGTLTGLPPSIHLPNRYQVNDWIVNWHDLALDANQSELLLEQLPAVYTLLERWQDTTSPIELMELLHPYSLHDLLLISAVLLPHRQQSDYLRYLSLLIHLKLLQVEMPLLTETLRQIFGESSSTIKPLLPAIAYFIYCSSHSFYGIQEQALKRLENRPSYLYHLILQEWAQNKRIRSFVRTWLSRQEQLAVKLLSAYDWEVIFYAINRGWAQSVVRDVYSMFQDASALAQQTVQPDTSKGFGNLRESSGVSFLATRQISDLLRRQSRTTVDEQTRMSHFEHFAQERFRKDVLRKEQRPNLNMPTLKRLERFVVALQQRAEQEQIHVQTACFWATKEILQAFAYLSPERLKWLGYELMRINLASLAQADDLEFCLTGMAQAVLQQVEHDLSHRPEGTDALMRLLSSQLDALMDHGIAHCFNADALRDLAPMFSRIIEQQSQYGLTNLYQNYFLTLNAE